jgi:hypothetical protein
MTESFWSAVQAIVWIATRSDSEVGRVRVDGATSDSWPFAPLSDRSLDDVDRRLTLEAVVRLRGEVGNVPSVPQAVRELARACGTGRLSMLGRLRSVGDPVEISRSAWAHLELRDHASLGVIAASRDMLDDAANWWSTLRIDADSIRKIWAPRQETRRYGYAILDEPDAAVREKVKAAQTARLRRLFAKLSARALSVGPDGLPNAAEVSLTEAGATPVATKAPVGDAGRKAPNTKLRYDEVSDWYRGRVASHDPATLPPTREDDERDARQRFGKRFRRDLVRRARKDRAPTSWTRTGNKGRKRQESGTSDSGKK